MLVLTIVSLTSVLGNRFYNQPTLTRGAIAPRTYIAPSYLTIVDTQETERLRKQARDGAVPVLKKDPLITEQILSNIQDYLNHIALLRETVGEFPYISETEILSRESQLYLRQAQEAEWQDILNQIGETRQPEDLSLAINSELNLQKEQVIAKLQYYQKKISSSEYQELLATIKKARRQYERTWSELTQNQNIQLTEAEKRLILDLSDEVWQTTEIIIRRTTRRILTQGIPQGIPEGLMQQTINVHLGIEVEQANPELLRDDIPETAKMLASTILLRFLQPNLIIDSEATAKLAETAAEAIPEQLIYINKDEIIVAQGEEISSQQFLKLDALGMIYRGVNKQGLGISVAIATTATTILWLSQSKSPTKLRSRDQILLCLLTVSSPLMAIFQVPYTSLPAVGLLTSSFYGPTVGITQVGVSTILTILADEISEGEDWEPLAVGAIGGIIAASIAGRLRDRDQLAQLGVGVGLSQWAVYFIIRLIFTSSPVAIWSTALQQGIYYGLLPGLGWSVFAIGISPYLERLFGLLTPSRLSELSNINQPLLKKLAEEAPGTWQHTLFVASLAEGAARKLNCNVELIRAGTLYHDIGKLHDPLGFIENQMGGPNKHDTINDPWASAAIIKKHVTQGIIMARRHELPKAISDFIPQHQGTMLIAYFYFQAKQIAEANGEPEVSEYDFRYDGPIPQSREAGIMMLADSCEAALRSLENANRDKALIMISKILKARWQDNQLVDSGLKYDELAIIASVFVDVWEQSKHRRIAYPKAALESPNK
ncbi:MAG: HDIG domain-containing protein [Gloeocapsa sp. DLM2.Bin57]|nr:MAG: HDIG domain-containing protein [Gloeocapsa sp. DLM2.Bin57]